MSAVRPRRRLRSELADRVSVAAREYRRELAVAVDEAIAAIRRAIDRASADHRCGEQHAHARLTELAQIERRCEQLARQFESLLGDNRASVGSESPSSDDGSACPMPRCS